jgi:Tol biopolymer transport system component/DNA-binding winged helix-turn-helix (wHTH) protein
MSDVSPFQLGSYTVFPDEDSLMINTDEKQSIQPKITEVLCYLVANYPRVVSRAELIEHIWDNNKLVGEKALTNTIWQIRQCFKYPGAELDIIETIRKRGYKLLVAPSFLNEESPSENPIPPIPQIHTHETPKRYLLTILMIVCCFLIVVAGYVAHSSNKKAFQPIYTQITKAPGSELFASPSPNGKQVVYVWEKATSRQLYLKNLTEETPPVQLTFGADTPHRAVWDPSQTYIYFINKNDDKRRCDIVRLNILTKEKRNVYPCYFTGGEQYIAISPDGKTLAFNSKEPEHTIKGLYLLNLDNEKANAVRISCEVDCNFYERDIAFSPNGKSLAVTRRRSFMSENIFIVDIATKASRQVTFKFNDIQGIAWHSDDKLVFGAQKSDLHRGYILDLTSLEFVPLNMQGFEFPKIGKEGTVFFQKRRESYFITGFSLSSAVSSSVFPIIDSEFSTKHPAYSSVTKKLAYLSNESGVYQVWVSDLKGQHRVKITDLNRDAKHVSWSMNGKKLLFTSAVDNEQDDVFIFDLDTQKTTQLALELGKPGRPHWHPNNVDIIVRESLAGNKNLYLLNTHTLALKQITKNSGYHGYMISDTLLVYTDKKNRLWQVDINHLDAAKMLLNNTQFNTRYSWNVFNKWVYFKSSSKKNDAIKRFKLPDGPIEHVLNLPLGALKNRESFELINESKTFLFTQGLSAQSNLYTLTHPLIN